MTDILEILENGRVDWSDEHQTTTTIITKNERLAIAEIKKLRARIAELETREKHLEEMFQGWRGEAIKASARIAEQDYLLEMKWRAEDRAIKAWQEETGEHMTWPDQAKLVEWLMDELDAARAALNGENG